MGLWHPCPEDCDEFHDKIRGSTVKQRIYAKRSLIQPMVVLTTTFISCAKFRCHSIEAVNLLPVSAFPSPARALPRGPLLRQRSVLWGENRVSLSLSFLSLCIFSELG